MLFVLAESDQCSDCSAEDGLGSAPTDYVSCLWLLNLYFVNTLQQHMNMSHDVGNSVHCTHYNEIINV